MTSVRLTLRTLREAKGLTQQQLAEAIGVRQATISDLETGKSRRIDLDLIEQLARVLGVKPGDLLERAAPEKSRKRKSP
jgi:transcriptional regulator with XRE-family HTH domain